MATKEELERYTDELYAIHKESSGKMMELTTENKKILETLEKKVLCYIEDIKWYGKLYLWLQLVLTIIFVAGWFWALHAFKKDFNWRLEVAYLSAIKLVKIQNEQNKILERIKPLDKEKGAVDTMDKVLE